MSACCINLSLFWHFYTIHRHCFTEGQLQHLRLVPECPGGSAALPPHQVLDGDTQVHCVPHHEGSGDTNDNLIKVMLLIMLKMKVNKIKLEGTKI